MLLCIFKDENGLSSFSSVEFRTIEEAKRAVEKMHQFEYGGRKLAVKLVSYLERLRNHNTVNLCVHRMKKVFEHVVQNINH